MSNNCDQNSYNKFSNLPNLPYNIVSYLMENNEIIWKYLKYMDSRPYEKPNLTTEEKGDLIYGGQPDSSPFRVFLSWGLDDSTLQEIAILRISVLEMSPTNYIYGQILIGCEIYSHFKIDTLANYTLRTDTIIQQLIETLNGADIPGLGKLFFDSRANSRNRVSVIGSIPMKGKILTIANQALG